MLAGWRQPITSWPRHGRNAGKTQLLDEIQHDEDALPDNSAVLNTLLPPIGYNPYHGIYTFTSAVQSSKGQQSGCTNYQQPSMADGALLGTSE